MNQSGTCRSRPATTLRLIIVVVGLRVLWIWRPLTLEVGMWPDSASVTVVTQLHHSSVVLLVSFSHCYVSIWSTVCFLNVSRTHLTFTLSVTWVVTGKRRWGAHSHIKCVLCVTAAASVFHSRHVCFLSLTVITWTSAAQWRLLWTGSQIDAVLMIHHLFPVWL